MTVPAARAFLSRHKWPVRLAAALVCYTLFGFFALPAILKWQMVKQLSALTQRATAVGQVKCNPYALSLTIRGFTLAETNGEPFVSFAEFYANFQLSSIYRRAWTFDEVRLASLFSQITWRADGQFNFADLLNQTNAPAASSKPAVPPRVLVESLIITNGTVAFHDLNRKTPFRTAFTPIDVRLTKFSTRPEGRNPYSFTASDDAGETFSWAGDFSINPLRSSGSFKVGQFQIKKYTPYLQDYASFEILDGKVDVSADYRYDGSTNALDVVLTNAAIELTQLQLKAPDTGETVIFIPTLSVQMGEVALARGTARIGLIKSAGGLFLGRRNKDGTPHLLTLIRLPANTNASVVASANTLSNAAPPWQVRVDQIQLDDYTLKGDDLVPAQPAKLHFDQIALRLKDVSNLTNLPIQAMLAFRFQETGTVALAATTRLTPFTTDAQIALTNVDLRAFQPYVEEQVKLVITRGFLTSTGHLRVALSEAGAPVGHFDGDVAVTQFSAQDEVLFQDFAKWDSLRVDGIAFDLSPQKIDIAQVTFTGLKASVNIGPDKRSNLQTILRDQIATKSTNHIAATESKPAPPFAPPINASLGVLVFENASFHFSDQSLQPQCNFDVQEFGGSIAGLSSARAATATVDLRGKVDAPSPFSVTGQVNPFARERLFADLAIVFTNTDLTAFTPYLEKFAGYPLQKGKLSMDLRYRIDAKSMKAENSFKIDRLTFGQKNTSPDATKLPVKLAVALLKDFNGRIELNVPVNGRLDDPQFKLGPIILKVFVNILTKAATSPFSLLGAMFGGGEELSFVEFEPGRAVIPDGETNKLNTLTKALTNRPALNLEIAGSVDFTNDRPALARLKLEHQIKAAYLKERADAGQAAALNDLKLETKDFERLIRQSYKTAFGKYKSSELLAQERAAAATNDAVRPATVAAVRPAVEERGAARLMNAAGADRSTSPPVVSKPAQPGKSRAQTELEDMAGQLAERIEVTGQDYRALMQARAAAVQKFLLDAGRIEAERLFMLAPKLPEATAKGESRVNLSLN